MKLLILYGGNFGERVIRNLVNDSEFCKSCDPLCTHCKYERYCYAESIIGTIRFPAPETLPDFIDDPGPYIPVLPSADIMIATEIHPDILMELPPRLNAAGIKGLIVPVEQSREAASGLAKQVGARCSDLGIESAFPKPFCSLKNSGAKGNKEEDQLWGEKRGWADCMGNTLDTRYVPEQGASNFLVCAGYLSKRYSGT